MNKTLFMLVVGTMIIFGFNSAQAELFISPVSKTHPGAMEGSVHFGTSSVEYEEDGDKGDIERTFLGATIAYGLNKSIDLYGTLSYTFEAELEDFPDDDTGYFLGGGVRGIILNNNGISVHGYAQLLLIDEAYGSNPTIEGEETSLMAGVAAATALNNNVKLYGGLELNLISDMTISANGNSADIERNDLLGLRLGANFKTGSFLLDVNTAFIHETGIFVSASTTF